MSASTTVTHTRLFGLLLIGPGNVIPIESPGAIALAASVNDRRAVVGCVVVGFGVGCVVTTCVGCAMHCSPFAFITTLSTASGR